MTISNVDTYRDMTRTKKYERILQNLDQEIRAEAGAGNATLNFTHPEIAGNKSALIAVTRELRLKGLHATPYVYIKHEDEEYEAERVSVDINNQDDMKKHQERLDEKQIVKVILLVSWL